jgi:predicted 3-demethylubiquinone-9 3-methyltransferase (glyoxalase superfamily)
MQKITPNLWFDNKAEEAVNFYISVFNDGKIGRVSRYSEAGAAVSGMPRGSVMTMEFELHGQKFLALNGGPYFRFSEAISFVVNCETQEEVDEFWEKLSEGGEPSRCGWLKDKYGLSWQIVPTVVGELMSGEPAKSAKVMEALLTMNKLDIATLKQAYEDPATPAEA